jgi:hypothetical protein
MHKLIFRREEAANEPRPEFIPKTLTDLNIEPIMDGLNGANSFKKPPPYSQNPPPSRHSTNDANNRAPVQSIGWNVPPAIRKSRKSLTLSGACWWRKRTNKLVSCLLLPNPFFCCYFSASFPLFHHCSIFVLFFMSSLEGRSPKALWYVSLIVPLAVWNF